MIITTKITETTKKLKNFNGGYITYFKLLPKLMVQYKIIKNQLNFFQKIKLFTSIFFQILFKPLFFIFHTETIYNCKYELKNEKISNIVFNKYSKDYTIYLFRFIPIFSWIYTEPKDTDIQTILQ